MKITSNKILPFFIATMIFTTSCQKDNQEETINSGKGTVTLKIGGTSFASAKDNVNAKTSNSKRGTISSPLVQQQEVSFNEDYSVSATLTSATATTQSTSHASTHASTITKGTATEALKVGTPYYIKVYEKGNRNKEIASKNFKHGIDDMNIEFELAAGEYTFVAFGNKLYDNGTYTSGLMHWKEDVSITAGKKTALNLVLANLFAEVTVTLNTGTIGNIEKINGGFIDPTYSINGGDGGKIDYYAGIVTYGIYQGPNKFSFPTQPSSSSWTTLPMPIQVKYTDKGEILLYGVSINGIMGNINLSNLIFEEGVKYNLQLTVGEKKEKTFKIGNLEFAMSNLYYDDANNRHYFLAGPDGDYFFPNYVKPKKMKVLNNKPNSTINGNHGDPCKLVKPLNSWRLPTDTEIKALFPELNIANWPSLNPNQNTHSSYFNNVESILTPKGIFFGTRVHPNTDRFNYLFLASSGYYKNSDYGSYLGQKGSYLLATATGNYAQLGITVNNTGTPGEVQLLGSPDMDMAISVRCVKN